MLVFIDGVLYSHSVTNLGLTLISALHPPSFAHFLGLLPVYQAPIGILYHLPLWDSAIYLTKNQIRCAFISWLYYLLRKSATLTSLNLCFFICKIKIIRGSFSDEMTVKNRQWTWQPLITHKALYRYELSLSLLWLCPPPLSLLITHRAFRSWTWKWKLIEGAAFTAIMQHQPPWLPCRLVITGSELGWG